MKSLSPEKYKTIITLLLFHAAILMWYLMFVVKPFNFWIMMSITTLILMIFSFILEYPVFKKEDWNIKNITIGLVSAAVLYMIFWTGNEMTRMVFPEKLTQVREIYSNRLEMHPYIVAVLLFFPIGMGEEIFWRGYLQKYYSKKFGEKAALFLIITGYIAVHLSSGNLMLILSAGICGIFWGLMFYFTKSVVPGIISHMVWDPVIFVILPIQ
ncbi:CPBP family intramembrane glutamic endopeptidase [candidate division KSB1 bacterium]